MRRMSRRSSAEVDNPRRRSEGGQNPWYATCTLPVAMSSQEKLFVYVVRSERDPDRHYTGLTRDVPRRVTLHNTAKSGHTVDYRPWRLVVAIECADEGTARRFERYLKSGSGRAFAKRHFGAGALLNSLPADRE